MRGLLLLAALAAAAAATAGHDRERTAVRVERSVGHRGGDLRLHFQAFDATHRLDLTLNEDLLAPGASVVVRGAAGEELLRRPVRRDLAYRGDRGASFVVRDDGAVDGVFVHAGAVRALRGGVAFTVEPERRPSLGADKYLADSPFLNYAGPFGLMDGCPSSRYQMDLGVATDTGYGRLVSGGGSVDADAVEADVLFNVNVANVLFADQANLLVRVAEIDVRTSSDDGEEWNQEPAQPSVHNGGDRNVTGCPVSAGPETGDDYYDYLLAFNDWRNAKPEAERFAAWHLLTDCFPASGTVGLAYMAATCSAYGTGWTSHAHGGMSAFVHELGHNLAASHQFDTSGVMSYDSDADLQFTGTNDEEVCGHIVSQLGSCFEAVVEVCGDGVVQPGEECDDDSGCCTAQCTLAGQCSPMLSGADCCSAQCRFQPSTTPCHDGYGMCRNGLCFSHSCVQFSNTQPACAEGADPCRDYCTIGGAGCHDMTAYLGSDAVLADGTVCDVSDGYRACDAGECVSAEALSFSGLPAGDEWAVGHAYAVGVAAASGFGDLRVRLWPASGGGSDWTAVDVDVVGGGGGGSVNVSVSADAGDWFWLGLTGDLDPVGTNSSAYVAVPAALQAVSAVWEPGTQQTVEWLGVAAVNVTLLPLGVVLAQDATGGSLSVNVSWPLADDYYRVQLQSGSFTTVSEAFSVAPADVEEDDDAAEGGGGGDDDSEERTFMYIGIAAGQVLTATGCGCCYFRKRRRRQAAVVAERRVGMVPVQTRGTLRAAVPNASRRGVPLTAGPAP